MQQLDLIITTGSASRRLILSFTWSSETRSARLLSSATESTEFKTNYFKSYRDANICTK